MGQNNGKNKDVLIPYNQRLEDEINESISDVRSKKMIDKFKQFINKKFKKNIEPSNFSHKFEERDSGLNNITNLLNVIYSKNINNNLEISSGRTIYETIFQYDIIENNSKDINIINKCMIKDMQNFVGKDSNVDEENEEDEKELNFEKNPFEVRKESKNISINNNDNIDINKSNISNSNSNDNIINDLLNDDNNSEEINQKKILLEKLKKKKNQLISYQNSSQINNSKIKEEKINFNHQKNNNNNIKKIDLTTRNKNVKKLKNKSREISPFKNLEKDKTPKKKKISKSPIQNKKKPLANIILNVSEILKSSKYNNKSPKTKKDFKKMDENLDKEIQLITKPETDINGKKYMKILNNENFLNVVDSLTQPNKQKKDLIQSFNYKEGVNNISKGRNKSKKNNNESPKRYSQLIYKKYK